MDEGGERKEWCLESDQPASEERVTSSEEVTESSCENGLEGVEGEARQWIGMEGLVVH